MKLIIQIPCYNEEQTLPAVVTDLPRELPGVDEIEYLVIDDGSTDATVETARRLGVHHVVGLGVHRGLSAAFRAGIRACGELGADLIVNTDGDHQYQGGCIRDLVAPILAGQADMVIGSRPIDQITEFSWVKKKLQRLGSSVVRRFSGTDLPDTTSGFRAYSADAALRLHVFNPYTYTLETVIQAGQMGMCVRHVPIQVNPVSRRSRLVPSVPAYVVRSLWIILHSYVIYRPLRTFFYTALLPGLVGLGICIRFLYYFFTEPRSGHVQSLILAAVLLLMSFHFLVLGLLADLSGTNRQLLQECVYLLRKQSSRRRNKAPGERRGSSPPS